MKKQKSINKKPVPLWKWVRKIFKDVPDSEWKKIPKDASVNLDHYIYRTSKIKTEVE